MVKQKNNLPFHSYKKQTVKRFPFLKFILVSVLTIITLIIVNGITTQYVASRFAYNPTYLG